MMSPALRRVAREAASLASNLPQEIVEAGAEAIGCAADMEEARRKIAESISHVEHRRALVQLLDSASVDDPVPSTSSLAIALLSASALERSHRNEQGIEVVWTGPDHGDIPFRRTEQVVLQILDSARERVTLVSYAVYEIPRVREALVRAAQRGVKLTVLLETPDRVAGESTYNTLRALGSEVARRSSVFYWPQEKRSRHGDRLGKLHVKCLVADGRWLLVSSANLTEHAFELNMELGLLLTGGPIPTEVERIFETLIRSRVICEIPNENRK